MSDLDRGALAKIDRRVLSGLGHDENYQMLRVPASEALWSTWRRYCEAVGISMGRAVTGLIAYELRTVVDQDVDGEIVLSADLERRLLERWEALDARQRRLRDWDQQLRVSERRIRAMARPLDAKARREKVGRNEPCPCGSGFKFKRCHGG